MTSICSVRSTGPDCSSSLQVQQTCRCCSPHRGGGRPNARAAHGSAVRACRSCSVRTCGASGISGRAACAPKYPARRAASSAAPSGTISSGAGPPSAWRLGSQAATSASGCPRRRSSSRRARRGRHGCRCCRSGRRNAGARRPRAARSRWRSAASERGFQPSPRAEPQPEERFGVVLDLDPSLEVELAVRHARQVGGWRRRGDLVQARQDGVDVARIPRRRPVGVRQSSRTITGRSPSSCQPSIVGRNDAPRICA